MHTCELEEPWPAESLPGRALAYSTNSRVVRAGKSALTIRARGVVASRLTGVKSATGSNGTLRNRLAAPAKDTAVTSSV